MTRARGSSAALGGEEAAAVSAADATATAASAPARTMDRPMIAPTVARAPSSPRPRGASRRVLLEPGQHVEHQRRPREVERAVAFTGERVVILPETRFL